LDGNRKRCDTAAETLIDTPKPRHATHLTCASKQPSTMDLLHRSAVSFHIPPSQSLKNTPPPQKNKTGGNIAPHMYRSRHKPRPSVRPSFSGPPPREGLEGRGGALQAIFLTFLGERELGTKQRMDVDVEWSNRNSVVGRTRHLISPRERPRTRDRGRGNLWNFDFSWLVCKGAGREIIIPGSFLLVGKGVLTCV
jgi:hypothetical protein